MVITLLDGAVKWRFCAVIYGLLWLMYLEREREITKESEKGDNNFPELKQ